MIVPTMPPWPRNLIPHEFSCQPKTRKFYPRNLIRVRYSIMTYINEWNILQRRTKVVKSPIPFKLFLRNLAPLKCTNILKHTKKF